jgi:putative tricarboxylic transport membrane protein
MRRISADVIIALLLLVICAVFYTETFAYQRVHLSIVGAKLWPRVVVAALFGLAAVYLYQSLRAGAGNRETPWSLKAWLGENRNVIACFALYGLFLLTLPWLGMLLGGSLFVFATLAVIGHNDLKSHLIHAAIAVVSIGLMWSVFTFALGVVLPQGEILPR